MSKKEKKTSKNETTLPKDKGADQVVEPVETDGVSAENEPVSASGKGQPATHLEEKEKELTELKDKYMRLLAEFENYKKRTIREKIDLMGTAAQDTLAALLPVLDDFDRAKANAEDENSKEYFSEGVKLVYQKLYTILNQQGLQPMETNEADFDPELHEAITEIPAPSEEMKGKIIDTVEKGYRLKDKIIRYAKVVVGK